MCSCQRCTREEQMFEWRASSHGHYFWNTERKTFNTHHPSLSCVLNCAEFDCRVDLQDQRWDLTSWSLCHPWLVQSLRERQNPQTGTSAHQSSCGLQRRSHKMFAAWRYGSMTQRTAEFRSFSSTTSTWAEWNLHIISYPESIICHTLNKARFQWWGTSHPEYKRAFSCPSVYE